MSELDPLETALAALREQPIVPPADLHTRCLATIPAPRRRWHIFGKGDFTSMSALSHRFVLRVALAGAVVAALFLLTTQPHRSGVGQPTAASAALAQAMEATAKAPWWHKHTRIQMMDSGFYAAAQPGPEQNRNPRFNRKPRLIETILETDTWYDFERGSVNISRDENPSPILSLPNGDDYDWDHNGSWAIPPNGSGKAYCPIINVLHLGAEHWGKMRKSLAEEVSEPYQALHIQDAKQLGRYQKSMTMTQGDWKGHPARVFIYTVNLAEGSREWPDSSRILLYADLKTGRFLGQEVLSRWHDAPELGEIKLVEDEYDYEVRPAVSRFAPTVMKRGVETAWYRDLYPNWQQGKMLDSNGKAICPIPVDR